MPEPTNPKSIPVQDVRPADDVPTDRTSTPVILSNRPMVRDPMFAEGADKAQASAEQEQMRHGTGNIPQTKLRKADLEPRKPVEPEKPGEKPPEEPVPADNPEPESKDVTEQTQGQADEIEAAKQTEHDQAIAKMIGSKEFALPITNSEKRRNKQVVIMGAIISVVLLLAWVDIALDAGIIHLGGIKPVTHFFSN